METQPQLRVISATDAAAANERLSIVVGILTFRRPDLLADFLAAHARIALPDNCDVTLLVVDNDASGSGRPTFDAWRGRIPNARFVIEPRVGIPVARNRAVHEALAMAADALCFIDDDEVPETEWLVNLVDAWQQSGADLVGGPVTVAPAPAEATPWQRLVNASLAARARRKSAMTARAAANGGRYTIVTNNWLCDLTWLASTGLRFDERLLLTGGSDTAFCRAAIAAGCRTAWATDAIVQETIGPERLTLRYQLWRGAAQSMTHYRMKQARSTPGIVAQTLVIAAIKTVLGILLMLFPVLGVGSIVMGIRSLGWAVGRVQALFGQESQLYAFAAAPAASDEPSMPYVDGHEARRAA